MDTAKRRKLYVRCFFFFFFNINEPSPHWLAWGQKSHNLVHIPNLVNGIWTETLSAITAICCKTAKCLATNPSLQSTSWRWRRAGRVRYSARKLRIGLEAKRAALRVATSESDAGTRPWAELLRGAGKELEMQQEQLLPFHLQNAMGF